MTAYRYQLDKSSKKYKCPQCGKLRLVRFIDIQLEIELPDHIGRCDREVKCGYYESPRAFLQDNKGALEGAFSSKSMGFYRQSTIKTNKLINLQGIAGLDVKYLKNSLKCYFENCFVQYLNTVLGGRQGARVTRRYKLGTAGHWKGATVFWQIGLNGKVHAGKIMLYNPETGKRVKKPFNHITWVHSVLLKQKKIKDFQLQQCLFGLHLVEEDKNLPIAIVESEKTACIMSERFPKYIWLACGSLSNIKAEMFQPLLGRKIDLFPDLGLDTGNGTPFDKWSEKAHKLVELGFDVTVSSLLEGNCIDEQREEGVDIADYFMVKERAPVVRGSKVDELRELKEKHPIVGRLVERFDLVFEY